MKAFWTLYWKEFKSNKIILLYIIIFYFGLSMPFKEYRIPIPSIELSYFLWMFSFTSLLIFPLAIFFLLASEKRENSSNLIFSLPSKRYLIILSQFTVIISYFILISTGYFIIFVPFDDVFSQMSFSEHLILYYFTVIPVFFMISSIISFIMALNSIIKRYRVALGIVFTNVLLLFCLALNQFVKNSLRWSLFYMGSEQFLDKAFKSFFGFGISHYHYMHVYWWLVGLIRDCSIYAVSLLFLFIGMYLFEKYAEV